MDGSIVEIPFDYGSESPADRARLAIVLAGISITPNTVVMDKDEDGISVHQLTPSGPAPERRDPKWPI
jgi:multisubunit Na+/H+ antiporter MnhE subunit